ncbi:MAG: serine/threonine-protein phosphatase [Chitinophagales bacterium]|nr:serine/threonine-protein phosphatase [Chitinophagales bacterium]
MIIYYIIGIIAIIVLVYGLLKRSKTNYKQTSRIQHNSKSETPAEYQKAITQMATTQLNNTIGLSEKHEFIPIEHIAFTNSGSRPTNQDAYFADKNLFIVCDGVGGNAYGEVASKIACTSLAHYFAENPTTTYDYPYLSRALHRTVQQFKETTNKYPETKGMATTVALIVFNKAGANIAWLGDSRVYHIRHGQILFVTEDHSLINELSKKGEDTSAIKKNFITKSLNAKADSEFSIQTLLETEIQKGDYFFLCTDGVLENITEEILCRELSSEDSVKNKAQKIFSLCEGNTSDNFTFQLIEV